MILRKMIIVTLRMVNLRKMIVEQKKLAGLKIFMVTLIKLWVVHITN